MSDPKSVQGTPPSVLRLCWVASVGIYASVSDLDDPPAGGRFFVQESG
jgi:hypothetical protein